MRSSVGRAAFAASMVIVVLAIIPFTPDPANDIKRLILASVAFVAACVCALNTRTDGDSPRTRPLLSLVIVFVSVQIVAAADSSYPLNSLFTASRFGVLAILCGAAYRVMRTPAQTRQVLSVVCAGVAVASIYGLCQHAGWDPFPWKISEQQLDEYRHLPATFGNPNYAGHALVLTIVLVVYLGLHRETRWCFGLAPLFLIHLYFTHERAGVVAIAAAPVVLVVAWACSGIGRRHPLRGIAATWCVTALVGVAGIAVALLVFQHRTGLAFPHDESLMLRYNSAQTASRMIVARPVLGWGPGNYEIESTPYWTPYEQLWYAAERQLINHVHCDVLESGADAGLIGAAMYLALLIGASGYALVLAFRGQTSEQRRLGYACAALFTAFFVDGLFGFNLRVPVSAMLLFVMIGAVEAAARTDAVAGRGKRWGVAARLVVVVVAAAALFAEGAQFVAQLMLHQGREAMAAKAFYPAVQLLAEAERFAPWDWYPPLELGRTAQARGDIETARLEFSHTLERNGTCLPAWISLAAIEVERANKATSEKERLQAEEAAISYATRVSELCSPSPEAWDIRGRIYAIGADRSSQRGQVAQAADQWRRAAESFRRALNQAGTSQVRAFDRLAEACQASGDLGGAEIAWERAVDAEPDNDSYWDGFVRFAEQTGRFDALRHALERQSELMNGAQLNAPRAEQERAYLTLRSRLADVLDTGYKDADEAEIIYRRAVRRGPWQAYAWTEFADFSRQHHRVPEFQDTVRRVTEEFKRERKDLPPALDVVNALWMEKPDAIDRAVALLERAAQMPSQDWPVAMSLGWAADFVADSAREAGESIPPATIARLGALCAKFKRWTQASELLGRSFEKLPQPEGEALVPVYCEALVQTKSYDKAVTVLREAHSRQPDNVDFWWSLARALVAAGRKPEARVQYRLLLQHGVANDAMRHTIESELGAVQNGPRE